MQPQPPPGTTYYGSDLSAEDYLRVRIREEPGRGVVAFTVQYEATLGGTLYPVVRYDSWREDPHRDLLDHEGRNVDKLWFPGWHTTTCCSTRCGTCGATGASTAPTSCGGCHDR